MNSTYLRKAKEIIAQRRTDTMTDLEKRRRIIREKVPEIAEINKQIVDIDKQIIKAIAEGGNVENKIRSIKSRTAEASAIKKNVLKNHHYPEDYLEPHYTCEKCQDTGILDNGKYCDCLKKVYREVAVESLNKTAQLQLQTFEDFSLDYYKNIKNKNGEDSNSYEIMKKIYNYSVDYAYGFTTENRSLLFQGKTGLGKTHLSLAIASVVIKSGFTVIYDSVINILRKIENEHFGRAKTDEDTLSLLLNADLVILDDLGTEYNTAFNSSTLYDIINTRLSRGIPTILSTNLDVSQLRKRYEERIVSRLIASYSTLKFSGKDVRMLKRQNKI